MKNLVYYLFLLFGSFSLISCEGPPGQDGFVNIHVEYYTINLWTVSDNVTYFYADVNCPQLTKHVYDEGVTVAYIETTENDVLVQNPLPWDQYRSNATGEFWTETISFDITQEKIRFYYEPSDFVTVEAPPQCVFKVVLMW